MEIRRQQRRIAVILQAKRCEGRSGRNAFVDPGLGIATDNRWAEQGRQGAVHAARDHVISRLTLCNHELGVDKPLAVGSVDFE